MMVLIMPNWLLIGIALKTNVILLKLCFLMVKWEVNPWDMVKENIIINSSLNIVINQLRSIAMSLEPDRRQYRNAWVMLAQAHGKMGC